MNRKAIFFILLIFLEIFNLSADERTKNIDVYLVLDKSLSMVEEIGSVKAYTVTFLVKNLLIPGDTFTLIPFYGKAGVTFSGKITSPSDKIKLEKNIESIKANGHFTDIGNALDVLKKSLSQGASGTRRTYVLLITDGKQEAPPESKYYSPDHTFNHEFLKNVKIIQKKGWKIEILGIGTESAARELARDLSGNYTEISRDATPEKIAEKVGNLLGTISVDGPCTLEKPSRSGKAVLTFTLVSKGYKKDVALTIDAIRLNAAGITKSTILDAPSTITVPPESKKKVLLEVSVPVRREGYNAELTFVFGSNRTFVPSVQNVYINKVVNYSLVLYSIIALIVVGIAVIIITRRRKPSDSDEEKIRKGEG